MSKGTLFIIDDDKAVLDSYEWMLFIKGYEIKKFHDGPSFLKNYKKISRSCLLLDVRMPKMTGFELHKIMVEKNIQLPIIFLTGHGNGNSLTKKNEKNVIAVLEKPVQPDILVTHIEKALSVSEMI